MQMVPADVQDIVHPAHTALVIWDMQEGIASRAFDPQGLRRGVERLVSAARAAGVLVVVVRHVAPALSDTSPVGLRALMRRQGVASLDEVRPRFQAESPEANLVAWMAPAPGDMLVEKDGPSLFIGTGAESRLRAHGIETIVLAGIATESGISFTARHAAALGFFAVVVEDAVGSHREDQHRSGLAILRSVVDVVPAQIVIDGWEAGHA